MSVVESHFERRGMRLNQNVGNDNFAGEVGSLALVMRILVVSDVVPGPFVASRRPLLRDVVGRQIVAHPVALRWSSTIDRRW